jgi:hypothetical protein
MKVGSRGFWIVIGAISGSFVGEASGVGAAHVRFACCYGETGWPLAGAIFGVLGGAIIAWLVVQRSR